jgi:hypothetical protein
MTTTKTATHIDHVIVGPQLANHGQYDVCEEPGERRLNRRPLLPGVPVAPLGPASSRSWSHCHKQQSVTRIPLDFEGRSRWSRFANTAGPSARDLAPGSKDGREPAC